ncbi:MAG: hypothetical protein ACX933_14920 [Marinobacter adhaerens]
MKNSTNSPSILGIIFVVVSIIFMPTATSAAEEMPDTEARVLTEGSRYQGVINSLTPDQSILIIDDRSFVLDRVVRFNNATWSREQVLNRLKPNDRVEVEVGPIADTSRGARLVVALRLLEQ